MNAGLALTLILCLPIIACEDTGSGQTTGADTSGAAGNGGSAGSGNTGGNGSGGDGGGSSIPACSMDQTTIALASWPWFGFEQALPDPMPDLANGAPATVAAVELGGLRLTFDGATSDVRLAWSGADLNQVFAAGDTVTVNTDDPTVSGINLSHEWEKAIGEYGLNAAEQKELLLNATRVAFCDDALRESLAKRITAHFAT